MSGSTFFFSYVVFLFLIVELVSGDGLVEPEL